MFAPSKSKMAKPAPLSKPPTTDKPLPETRPGTAGTVATQMLTSNRRAASSAFQRAYRAEQSHIVRKKASAARTGLKEAKGHFRLAGKELWAGLKKTAMGAGALPSMLLDKRAEVSKKRDEKMREKALRMKKLWEEKAAAVEAGEAEVEKEGSIVSSNK
jgi:hypothetical protein